MKSRSFLSAAALIPNAHTSSDKLSPTKKVEISIIKFTFSQFLFYFAGMIYSLLMEPRLLVAISFLDLF